MHLNTLAQFITSRTGSLALVVLLVLAGGFLRFYNLGAQSYWMDEGYTVNAIMALQEKGEPVLDSGLRYTCPLYCWPSAWIANTFGNTPTAYRALSALAGTLFIAVIFFTTRHLFTLPIALVSTALVAFSHIHIAWSRQARWYTLFTLFFWLALYFFYRALHDPINRTRNTLLTALATLLACLTHPLGYLLPLIFLAWTLATRYSSLITRNSPLVTPSSSSLVTRDSSGEARTRNSSLITRPSLLVTRYSLLATGLLALAYSLSILAPMAHLSFGYPYYLMYYLHEYWSLMLLIPFVFLPLRVWPNREHEALTHATHPSPLATSSSYSLLTPRYSPLVPRYSPHRRSSTYLALAFIAYLLPLTFLTDTIQYRYLFHLTPVLFILATVGLFALHHKLTNRSQKILLWSLFAILFITQSSFLATLNSLLVTRDSSGEARTRYSLLATRYSLLATRYSQLVPRYYLESDPPISYFLRAPYGAYVPQPDWHSAYAHIATHRTPEDTIISSQAVFTKIFLDEPGYAFRYSLSGTTQPAIPEVDGREYYVGAPVLATVEDLDTLMASGSGFIIFDRFATDGRIPEEMLAHIRTQADLVFEKRENEYSEVWVYRYE